MHTAAPWQFRTRTTTHHQPAVLPLGLGTGGTRNHSPRAPHTSAGPAWWLVWEREAGSATLCTWCNCQCGRHWRGPSQRTVDPGAHHNGIQWSHSDRCIVSPGLGLRLMVQCIVSPGLGLRLMVQCIVSPGLGLRLMVQCIVSPGLGLRLMVQCIVSPGLGLRLMVQSLQPQIH